jgi:hypothetical protein
VTLCCVATCLSRRSLFAAISAVSVEEPTPDAFWTKVTEVSIRGGRRKKFQLQFLPFRPGTHSCQLVFLDPQHGEFVYEVRGVATLPQPLQELKFIADMKAAVMKDLKVPPKNSQYNAANSAALDRLDRKSRTQAVSVWVLEWGALLQLCEQVWCCCACVVCGAGQLRVKDAQAREQAANRAKAAAAGADVPPQGTTYDVELSSPYFEAPKQIFVRTEDDVGGEGGDMFSPTAKSRMDGEGGVSSGGQGVNDAVIQTPRGGDPTGLLPLSLHPKAAGVYPCKIVLRSSKDVRVYHVEATILEEGIARSLEFVAPARQSITQDIPIVNNTDLEWSMAAKLTGSEYFKGGRVLNVAPHSIGVYTITFRPEWVGDFTAELVLENTSIKSNAGQVPMQFTFKGVGLEPLAEEHVIIACKARDRIKRSFVVKNPSALCLCVDGCRQVPVTVCCGCRQEAHHVHGGVRHAPHFWGPQY